MTWFLSCMLSLLILTAFFIVSISILGTEKASKELDRWTFDLRFINVILLVFLLLILIIHFILFGV